MSVIANDFIDFYYCGHTLSEYDGVIGDINGGEGVGAIEIGNILNLNPIDLKPLKKRKSVASIYDTYIEKTFSFFKKPCGEFNYYTREEVSEIIRWLNQPRYEKFTPVYSDTTWPAVHYYASFNIKPIIYIGHVIGFELDMTTNAPFGYYEEVIVTDTGTLSIEDTSDEQGFIYPECSITVHSDGHLILSNSRELNNKTIIANCNAGETITVNGQYGTITSSVPHVNLYNDFNYVFPKIWNRMDSDGTNNIINVFHTNHNDSDISIRYEPISKFGLI